MCGCVVVAYPDSRGSGSYFFRVWALVSLNDSFISCTCTTVIVSLICIVVVRIVYLHCLKYYTYTVLLHDNSYIDFNVLTVDQIVIIILSNLHALQPDVSLTTQKLYGKD